MELNEDFTSHISYSTKNDTIIFYDRFNQTRAKDGASGAILVIGKSNYPDTVAVPGILLNYEHHSYIEAGFETGVEFSLASKEFQRQYEESKQILLEALTTFQLAN